MLKSFFVAALVSVGAMAATQYVDGDTFELYGYGNEIGGDRVVSRNNVAYLASPSNENNTAVVDFAPTFTLSGTSWLVVGSDSTSSFFIPATDSPLHNTGFVDTSATNSSVQTSGFVMYGKFALHTNPTTSAMESLFFAIPTVTEGLHVLAWNVSDNSDAVPIQLRTKAPVPPRA